MFSGSRFSLTLRGEAGALERWPLAPTFTIQLASSGLAFTSPDVLLEQKKLYFAPDRVLSDYRRRVAPTHQFPITTRGIGNRLPVPGSLLVLHALPGQGPDMLLPKLSWLIALLVALPLPFLVVWVASCQRGSIRVQFAIMGYANSRFRVTKRINLSIFPTTWMASATKSSGRCVYAIITAHGAALHRADGPNAPEIRPL